MSNLRRYYIQGNIYFVTCVTYKRLSILLDNIDILWNSINKQKRKTDFDIIAWVILPDHIHMLMDPKDNNLSKIIQKIKMSFAAEYRNKYEMKSGRTWQNRFWDHIIRDQTDMNHHIDYIHYNPVKHMMINRPDKWKHSSIHLYLKQGLYSPDWSIFVNDKTENNYGE